MKHYATSAWTDWTAVAAAARARGDDSAEEAALDAQLQVDRRDLAALIGKGELLARRGDPRGAVGFFQLALQCAVARGGCPPAVRERLQQAHAFVAEAQAGFAEEVRARLAQAGLRGGNISPRTAEAVRMLLGEAPLHVQQPTKFYFPGLAQRPFFEREEFDWVPALESATEVIRDEMLALLGRPDSPFGPHTGSNPRVPPPSSPLLDDPRWSACHLWQRGRECREATRHLPRTMAALAQAPIPHITGCSPMAMFSLLKPGTRIPPHHGISNTRLICHLPLLAPDGCGIRVGNAVRHWQAGKLLIFDDSFEHEAWNEGREVRVVLLFEIWRPDLSAAERAELTALFEAVELGGEDEA